MQQNMKVRLEMILFCSATPFWRSRSVFQTAFVLKKKWENVKILTRTSEPFSG